MNDSYREATRAMERMGVVEDYLIGWQGGFLGHPKREEQRNTEAYEAGYQDGRERNTANFANWAGSASGA